MITLQIKTLSSNLQTIKVEEIVSIDGQPLASLIARENVLPLEHRVAILEAAIGQLASDIQAIVELTNKPTESGESSNG